MNGQGVGGVWWVVTPNGNPIAHASVVETELGPVFCNFLLADEIYRVPRSWAEQAYPNLVHYAQHDRGGTTTTTCT